VNRDSLLFLLIGLLAGFLAGYVVQEEMAERQPQRLSPAAAAAAAGSASVSGAAPGMAGASGGGAPMQRIEELRRRLEADPDDQAALLELANLNFDIQNWARAKELYERLLTLRPGDPDVLTDLGISLRSQGDFDGALARFREAQKVAPNHWQARFNEIVVLAIDRNDAAAASARLAELEKLAPGNADVARLAEEVRRRQPAGR
jgi:tetratricopeptide (TPR) repeat protein